MPLCVSVYMCFVVTCWERADLLALVCGVRLLVCHFPIGILGQVWYLIVSIPDLCTLTCLLTLHLEAAVGLCLTLVFTSPNLGSRPIGGKSNLTIWSHGYTTFVKLIRCTMTTKQITNPAISDTSKGNKPPLVGEHDFSLMECVG